MRPGPQRVKVCREDIISSKLHYRSKVVSLGFRQCIDVMGWGVRGSHCRCNDSEADYFTPSKCFIPFMSHQFAEQFQKNDFVEHQCPIVES